MSRTELPDVDTHTQVYLIINALVINREAHGYTQTDVGALIGLTGNQVSDIEACSVIPSIATLIRYANVVGLRFKLVAG